MLLLLPDCSANLELDGNADTLITAVVGATSTDPSRLATVGRLCKRFIDVGRAIFLVERGYDVVLCKYVPEDVTRENTALLARPAGAGAAAQ